MSNKKTAVIYYSYSGNIRKIVNLIDEIADVDVFELVLLEDYPRGLNELIPIAKHEVDNRTGRAYRALDISVSDYDNLIICTPNWGDTVAPPILTFLRQNDISTCKIMAVVTHQGTGKGRIVQDIEQETRNAKVQSVFVDYHERTTKAKLEDWLNSLSL